MQTLANCACTGKSLPKLLRPVLLSVLAKGDAHGYVILDEFARMGVFGSRPPDHTGVYRALQAMEKEGHLVSDWEHPPSGSPRRRYRLTAKGRACLAKWKQTLREYRRTIDVLLQAL